VLNYLFGEETIYSIAVDGQTGNGLVPAAGFLYNHLREMKK